MAPTQRDLDREVAPGARAVEGRVGGVGAVPGEPRRERVEIRLVP